MKISSKCCHICYKDVLLPLQDNRLYFEMPNKSRLSTSHVCQWILLTLLSLASGALLDYSNSNLAHVPQAPNDAVEIFKLDNNRITHLDNRSFTNYSDLLELYISFNHLQTIDDGTFDMLYSLQKINIQNNDIVKLPADFGPSTETLMEVIAWNAFKNPNILTYPYFAAFPGLWYLNIGANYINIHDGSVFPASTEYVTLHYTNIDTFPQLSIYTPNVTHVHMDGNRLVTIPQETIQALTFLMEFYTVRNRITQFPNFSHCSNLEIIAISNNAITNIPRGYVAGLASIQYMDLSLNAISDMPDISDLATLHTVIVGFNQISEIPEAYLSGLPNMTYFDCQGNNLLFLPNISHLFPRLEQLYVQGNRLMTLPDLYAMPSLAILYAADNPYVCNETLCWMRMLSWLLPSVTMLQDDPVCAEPPLANGTRVVRYHPAAMKCYQGISFDL